MATPTASLTEPRIFISYVREDAAIASRIYRDLRLAGFDPWLDTENLRPGEKWRDAIENAIRESTFFIALLSSQSVAKRGFAQREVRVALDVLSEIPSGGIFLIPLRLDDCAVHERQLNELHRLDLFPSYDHGIRRLIDAIRPQAPPRTVGGRCVVCDTDVPVDVDRCIACWSDVSAPNVRHALSEAFELDARYRTAVKALGDRRFDASDLEQKALAATVLIPCTPQSARRLMHPNHLWMTYAQLSEAGIRRPMHWENIRTVIDAMLFPEYGHKLVFAVLSLDGTWPLQYGGVCLMLRESFISARTTLTEGAAFAIAQRSLGDAVPVGLRATWSDRHKAAVNHFAYSTDPPDHHLECQIYGSVARATMERIVVRPELWQTPEIKLLRDAAEHHGVNVTSGTTVS